MDFASQRRHRHHVAPFDGPKLPWWWHDGPKILAAYLRNILPGFAARCASRSGRLDVRHDGPDIPAAYPQTMSGRRRRPSPSEGSSQTSLPTRMPKGLAEHGPYVGSRRILILQSTKAQVQRIASLTCSLAAPTFRATRSRPDTH